MRSELEDAAGGVQGFDSERSAIDKLEAHTASLHKPCLCSAAHRCRNGEGINRTPLHHVCATLSQNKTRVERAADETLAANSGLPAGDPNHIGLRELPHPPHRQQARNRRSWRKTKRASQCFWCASRRGGDAWPIRAWAVSEIRRKIMLKAQCVPRGGILGRGLREHRLRRHATPKRNSLWHSKPFLAHKTQVVFKEQNRKQKHEAPGAATTRNRRGLMRPSSPSRMSSSPCRTSRPSTGCSHFASKRSGPPALRRDVAADDGAGVAAWPSRRAQASAWSGARSVNSCGNPSVSRVPGIEYSSWDMGQVCIICNGPPSQGVADHRAHGEVR